MKDIVIGAVDGYNFEQVAPWILSLKESGFDGEIWLVVYRADERVVASFETYGVNVYKVDHDPFLRPIQHAQAGTPTQAHNLRFFHAWELLTRLGSENYRYCIMTDVRDVYFQKNPSEWLVTASIAESEFLAPSEGIMFGDESWNKDNMIQGHGPVMWDLTMYDKKVYNVGTIAGGASTMHRLFYLIYSMTCGRHYPADQSSFNILVSHILAGQVRVVDMWQGWAAQIGTTLDPTKSHLWPHNCEPKPRIGPDNLVYTEGGQPFVMVHQWDRNPTLKSYITQKYSR
jgi:hypothetical protein